MQRRAQQEMPHNLGKSMAPLTYICYAAKPTRDVALALENLVISNNLTAFLDDVSYQQSDQQRDNAVRKCDAAPAGERLQVV
jgi:hypothetical protein